MPMIPEAVVAMLACARIGAIHSVVFGGFSPDALAGRIDDSQVKVVITADEGVRGGRSVALKKNVDEALTHPTVNTVERVIVVKRTGADVDWHRTRDVWYHDAIAKDKNARKYRKNNIHLSRQTMPKQKQTRQTKNN